PPPPLPLGPGGLGGPRAGGAAPPRGSAQLVVLEKPAADDHPLDVGGALADQQHRRLAVEPLDLVLLGEAVAAVDPEGVLDDLGAVLRGEVLGHAGLEVVALAGVLLAA